MPGGLSALDARLFLLNLWLRATVKTKLRRLKDPVQMRALMERDAARNLVLPEGSQFVEGMIRRPGLPRALGAMDALWASRGRPDRRKVLLYLHGGAYLAGSPRTHRHLAAALAGAAGIRVLVPDYRLAPEEPFPAALEDAVSAYEHLLAAGYTADEIAVGGDSAGGGLGFALTLKLMEAGLPQPACVVAFSPWADMTRQAASLRHNAARDVMLPVTRMQEAAAFYLGHAAPGNPLASPVFGVWRDPPPALIMASRSEILLDDSIALAARLREAGGNVQLELWQNLPHAWPVFQGLLRQADLAVATAGAFIARHVGAEPEG